MIFLSIWNQTATQRLQYLPVGMLVAAMAAAVLLKWALIRLTQAESILHLFVALVLLGMLCALIPYRSARSSLVLLRGISLSLGFYVALLWPGFSVPESTGAAIFTEYARWVVVLAAVGAWYRPGLAVIPAGYILMYKSFVTATTRVTVSATDYMPVVEVALLLSLGGCLISWFCRDRDTALRAGTLLFFCAVAIHFGNYFWSGVAKMQLDGGPLKWVLENRTSNLILVAQELGNLPMSETTGAAVFSWVDRWIIPVNLLTLTSQLLAIVCIVRARWLFVLTAFYDLIHIAIFVLTGIFFWKWILMNFAILIAARHEFRTRFSMTTSLLLVLLVPLADTAFFAARLGWYDTRALVVPRYEAVTSGGDRVRVPSNYFLATSVTVAQQRLAENLPVSMGTYTYATAFDLAVKRMSETADCPSLTRMQGDPDTSRVERIVRAHHAHVLSLLNSEGTFNYDLYPHHIFSYPLGFPEFDMLDKRTIDHYLYSVQAVCLGFENGNFTRTITAHKTYKVDV